MTDLSDRQAIVTGAGSGIGAAIATAFAAAGAQVIIAERDQASGEEVRDRIRDAGGRAEHIACDVADATSVTEAFAGLGNVDILVNNAGIGHVGTIQGTTADDLDRMHAVNVRGVFNCSKAVIDGMLAHGTGCIINMASIGGVVGIRDRLAYCATKFAVVGITKSMALDHSPQGVRVNCICPGRVETPFVQARISEYDDPTQAAKDMAATQLTGRMVQPHEIAGAALYLASDAAASVTGTCFMVDGGWSAGK